MKLLIKDLFCGSLKSHYAFYRDVPDSEALLKYAHRFLSREPEDDDFIGEAPIFEGRFRIYPGYESHKGVRYLYQDNKKFAPIDSFKTYEELARYCEEWGKELIFNDNDYFTI